MSKVSYPHIVKTKYNIRMSFLRDHYGPRRERKEREFDEEGDLIRSEKSIADSIRRAKCAVVDYCMNNDFTHFGTITINGAWFDISSETGERAVLEKILNTFDYYRQYVSDDFRYILCPEYGEKNGRLHFHFVVKGIKDDDLFINTHRYLDWRFMKERFGHIQITKIGDTHNDHQRVAFYCSKYISKNFLQLSKQRYFHSKDLRKPDRFCMHRIEYAMKFKDWLELNDMFDPYYEDKAKGISCFSLPPRVFYDMLEACGIYVDRKRECFIFDSFLDCFLTDSNGVTKLEVPEGW